MKFPITNNFKDPFLLLHPKHTIIASSPVFVSIMDRIPRQGTSLINFGIFQVNFT